MSSTNKTTNLELSQFIGSDSPKWLTDYNADMEKIDAGYQTVKAQADATGLIVDGHTTSLNSLQTTVSEQGTAISGLRTDVTANTGSINTINSLIGNGEPTTTDKTLIGAINEIQAEVEGIAPDGDIKASSVTYSNTSSGLTATNVQTAIDEVEAKMGSVQTVAEGYVFSSSPDGTKTYGQLANEAINNLLAVCANHVGKKIVIESVLILGVAEYVMGAAPVPISANMTSFNRQGLSTEVDSSNNTFTVNRLYVGSFASINQIVMSSGSVAVTDQAANAATGSVTITYRITT